MIKFWTLFKHDLYNLISSPGTLSVFLIFPTILILLMGFLFDNLYHTTIISSYDFYGVTMIFFIVMMGATVPANAFLEKHIKNGNTRIFYSPVSRVSIYSSKILTCFLFMALALTINIIIFDTISLVNFSSDKIGYVILLIINFVLFLTILSSAICVTLHSEELTNVILSNSMSFGRPYILDIHGCVHDGWLIISDYQDYLDPLFFYYELRSDLVQRQFDGSANGSCVKNLNSDLVKKVRIHVPPMDRQKEFVEFAQQSDKSKFELQDAIDNLDALSKKIIAENLIAAGKE